MIQSCPDCDSDLIDDCCPICDDDDFDEDYDDDDDDFDEDYWDMSDAEADADVLKSAGWGTDEDYGQFDDRDEY